MAINPDSRVFPNKDILYAAAGDELMMMNTQAGKYFGLDPIGRRIWELLVLGTSDVHSICVALTDEYDVPDEVCKTEVLRLLTEMSDEGLIGTVDEQGNG